MKVIKRIGKKVDFDGEKIWEYGLFLEYLVYYI